MLLGDFPEQIKHRGWQYPFRNSLLRANEMAARHITRVAKHVRLPVSLYLRHYLLETLSDQERDELEHELMHARSSKGNVEYAGMVSEKEHEMYWQSRRTSVSG